jgi:hypothetical protein
MMKDGTWAGNMELQAGSLVTNRNICIHMVFFNASLPSDFWFMDDGIHNSLEPCLFYSLTHHDGISTTSLVVKLAIWFICKLMYFVICSYVSADGSRHSSHSPSNLMNADRIITVNITIVLGWLKIHAKVLQYQLLSRLFTWKFWTVQLCSFLEGQWNTVVCWGLLNMLLLIVVCFCLYHHLTDRRQCSQHKQ